MKIKKILLILILLVSSFALCACSPLEEFYITKVKEITICVDEEYNFGLSYYKSSDEEVFKIDGTKGIGLKEGKCEIINTTTEGIVLIVNVKETANYITLSGQSYIKQGEKFTIESVVSPISVSQEVSYESSDENVLTVDQYGKVTGVNEGFATICVTSVKYPDVKSEFSVIVQNEDELFYEPIVQTEVIDGKTTQLNANDINGLLDALTMNVKNVLVGVEKYTKSVYGKETSSDFGAGIIYKRNAILTDGTIVENVDYTYNSKTIKSYEYYIISSRNLVKGASKVLIKVAENVDKVEGTVIQYDPKIDLSVIKFTSKLYLSTAKFGNSDLIKQGEFIISLGNGSGEEYFRSATFGIISYTKRYVSTDTDGDQVSDWDSEYIQHDSTINTGDNGGALINMKGELIGINSTKIVDKTEGIACISFAVPINLAKEIVAKLETGVQPQRPLLGVTIIDVKGYYQAMDYYNQTTPSTKDIPLGLEYGFFITEVNAGGVAEMATLQPGDIIIEFNGVQTKYSYNIRAELGKFIIGSGQTTEIKVIRNGEEMTFTVTF